MSSTRKRTRRLRRQRQKGGAYVNHGTYGCGFRPALRCEGEATRRPGKFAKLVVKEDAYEEMKLMRMLRAYDPHQEFFLYPETICKPAPYTHTDEMAKCPHDFTDRDEARVIILTKGGKAISRFQPARGDYPAFFHSLTNLFHGLQRIHAAGVAHNDIKPDNVVTRKRTDGTYLTKFIDFGLMANGDDLESRATKPKDTMRDYNVLQANYRYWSFDMRMTHPGVLASAMAQSASTGTRIQRYYSGLAPDTSFPFRAFYHQQLTLPLVSQIARQLDAMPIVNRHKFIMTNSDILGLGVTLAQVYYRLTGHRDRGTAAPEIVIPYNYGADWIAPQHAMVGYSAADRAWNIRVRDDISIPFYRLIRQMIHVNPFSRISIEDALIQYEDILAEMDGLFTSAQIVLHLKATTLQLADPSYPVLFAPPAGPASSSPAVAAAVVDDVLGFEHSPFAEAEAPELVSPHRRSSSRASSGGSWHEVVRRRRTRRSSK